MLRGIKERSWNACTHWNRIISVLGIWRTLPHVFRRFAGIRFPFDCQHPQGLLYPVFIRFLSSDLAVYEQVILENEYEPLYRLTDARLVIDCGANVGYSSACFLSRFPNCSVVAVEPDAENFAMLKRNLRPYARRVKLVRAGVWSRTTPLVIREVQYRDGREWTRQVRPCEANEKTDLEGVSIESLLAASGHERISLLKMDIEGAEAVVFRGRVDWLDKVDAVAIELHDDSHFGSGSDAFYRAIAGKGFEITTSGELTICVRRKG